MSEEIDKNRYSNFLQPANELRHALEHIIRAKASELGLQNDVNNDYIESNLDKALGHEYRAFFDLTDWLGVILRDKITELISPYSTASIQITIPDYYNEIRPSIAKIDKEIAEIRKTKDISRESRIIDQVNNYFNVLNKLYDYYITCIQAIESLEELRKREQRTLYRNLSIQIIIGIILLLIGFFSKELHKFFF